MTADLFLTLLLAVSLVGLLILAVVVALVFWLFRVTRGMKGLVKVEADFDGALPARPETSGPGTRVNLFNAEEREPAE